MDYKSYIIFHFIRFEIHFLCEIFLYLININFIFLNYIYIVKLVFINNFGLIKFILPILYKELYYKSYLGLLNSIILDEHF